MKTNSPDLLYKSQTYQCFEEMLEKLWIRYRRNTTLPLRAYCRYWFLRCTPPW